MKRTAAVDGQRITVRDEHSRVGHILPLPADRWLAVEYHGYLDEKTYHASLDEALHKLKVTFNPSNI